jgi:hypothetical protein
MSKRNYSTTRNKKRKPFELGINQKRKLQKNLELNLYSDEELNFYNFLVSNFFIISSAKELFKVRKLEKKKLVTSSRWDALALPPAKPFEMATKPFTPAISKDRAKRLAKKTCKK